MLWNHSYLFWSAGYSLIGLVCGLIHRGAEDGSGVSTTLVSLFWPVWLLCQIPDLLFFIPDLVD